MGKELGSVERAEISDLSRAGLEVESSAPSPHGGSTIPTSDSWASVDTERVELTAALGLFSRLPMKILIGTVGS
jgi:hypothetical protein